MPYITPELREDFEEPIQNLIKLLDWVDADRIDGTMNYIITRLIRSQYNNGRYAEYNSAIGVLECAKLELYRKAIGPYEDIKLIENGDI
jgi:hypothetical protein